MHYSVAVRHLRVPLSELVRLMGPVSAREDAYDEARLAPEGLADLSVELCDVDRRFAPKGCPRLPPFASSTSLLRGDEKAVFCALTLDSSPLGWAALVCW